MKPEELKTNEHDKHCFIAVPYGKDEAEHAHIEGWVGEVIIPVVVDDLKLSPEVATKKTAPNAITVEIREHLAFDRLAFFDLGGAAPLDPPNPNVMYELGIRHAFDLPAVVLAWDEQSLPFDISEHRVIRNTRHFGTLQWHRKKLKEFAEAALKGEFFRPMQAVRVAQILDQAAAQSNDTTLVALIEQIKELRHEVSALKGEHASITGLRRAFDLDPRVVRFVPVPSVDDIAGEKK